MEEESPQNKQNQKQQRKEKHNMDEGRQKRDIKNDMEEINTRSKKALELFGEGKHEDAKGEIEEIYTTCDFVISELDTMMEEEEKKEEAAETTPPPQSSPPEPISVPVGSPE